MTQKGSPNDFRSGTVCGVTASFRTADLEALPDSLSRVDHQELIRPRDLTEVADLTRLGIWRCRRIRECGVIADPASALDVVPARVYAHLMDYPRPDIPQGRAVRQEKELKWLVVAEKARDLVTNLEVTLQTVMWVMPDGSTLVGHNLAERADIERARPLTDVVCLQLPLGFWIRHDLPYALGDPLEWARQLQTPAQHKRALDRPSSIRNQAGPRKILSP
jgi:hypothetical protein